MNKRKSIILIFFMLGMSFLIFPKSVKGLDDIAYTFDDNVLIDSSISEFDDTWNIRNSSEYTGHYNATYSFENEIDLESTEISFISVDNSDIDTSTSVYSEFSSHSEVLRLLDQSTIGIYDVSNILDTNVLSGIIEFWIGTNDTSTIDSRFITYEVDTPIIYLGIRYNDLEYYNGTAWIEIVNSLFVNDILYHIKLVINDSSNTFDCYVNTILVGIDLSFRNPSTLGMNSIRLTSGIIPKDNILYIDAIGYSWLYNSSESYSYDFNELTSGLEFETIGIYSEWLYTKDSDTIITVNDTGYSQECLDFIDSNSNGYPKLVIPILNTSNSLEIYIRSNDTFPESYVYLQEGSTLKLSIGFYIDKFNVYDDTGDNYEKDVIDNTWYKVNIIWNAISDTFKVWFNNEYLGTYIFTSATTEINNLEIRTDLFDYDYTFDIDDLIIDTRILNYTIGTNLFPYENYTGFIEVDKYEFALKDINYLNPRFSTNPIGWSLSDSGTGQCEIELISGNTYDRTVQLFVVDNGDSADMRRENIISEGKFINITTSFTIFLLSGSGTGDFLTFECWSHENNYIFSLLLTSLGVLSYYNGTDYIELRSDLTDDFPDKYTFNIFINHELNIVFFDYIFNDVLIEQYNWSTLEQYDSGISKIDIFLLGTQVDGTTIRFDYVGIYDNGKSLSTEYGYSTYSLNSSWNTEVNNLLYTKANGTFHIGLVEGSYIIGESMTEYSILRDYYNILSIDNGYDSNDTLTNATFVFTILGNYFTISLFKIDGVLLKEGVNEYNLEFEHSHVNIDDSYFYVSDNKLYFKHTSDDSNLEYIKATFNINNESSSDFAFSFRSYKDNNAYGYMRVNFIDTSNLLEIPNILTTTRFLLTQNRTITKFIILITDKDNDIISGNTNGYVYNIELLSILDISVSVITESLLNMIIPLIIIITPTLAFSKRFGNQVIVPFFILFSLVLTITNVIPYWLFFIIVFPSIIMMFFKGNKEVV